MQTVYATPQKKLIQEEIKSIPKRVLCVEDDRDTCEVLHFIMTDYDFTAVSTVAEAERLIRSERFDLYVLDNWLPDGLGVELCEKIRELGNTAPIVFTSAVAQRQDIDLAMKAGADRYLVKPYEPEVLVQTVKDLLEPSSNLAFES